MTVSVISQPPSLPREVCHETFEFWDQSPLGKGREAFVSGTKYKEAPRNSSIRTNTARGRLSADSVNSRARWWLSGPGGWAWGQGRGEEGAPTFSAEMNKV